MKRQLNQSEIDQYFSGPETGEQGDSTIPFDFRRLDRIPKSQLSIVHFLHEAFVRSITSSLSLYLRSYVSGSIISVEQLPYADFADGMPPITCLAYLNMLPYDGHCVAQIDHTLISPIVDYLLGGNGLLKVEITREVTELEQNLLGGVFRIIGRDLAEAWKPVASIEFGVMSVESKLQLTGRIARDETVVAIAIELRIGEEAGILNVVIPSITLKMMHQHLNQQWGGVRKTPSKNVEDAIKRALGQHLTMDVDVCVTGSSIRLSDSLNMRVGSILDLGVPADGGVVVCINGTPKFQGELATVGNRNRVIINCEGN